MSRAHSFVTGFGIISGLIIALGAVPALSKVKLKPVVVAAPALSVSEQAAVLRDAALKSNIAYEFTEQLTTRFGARLAGSASERNASIWAAETLKSYGFSNVRIETFPLSLWERGEESIEITAPFPQKLVGTALGMSKSTPAGGIEAEAVMFETFADFAGSNVDVTGKIVVILQPMAQMSDGGGYGRLSGPVRGAGPMTAQQRGAVGFVMRSLSTDTDRFAHTGTTAWSETDGTAAMAISAPDANNLARIRKMQKRGEAGPLRLKIKTGGKFLGVGTSQNVVADLVGTEHPEQMIVIGGHMDSWDTGTGAVDDGAGLGITIAAAKVMIDHGLKPKRTVRVVLWGAEEVSQPKGFMKGGFAYAAAHKDELKNYIVAGESDFGVGKVNSVALMPTKHQDFVAQLANVLAPLAIPIDLKKVPNGGTDTAGMHQGGVPAIDLNQDGYNYFDIHHTPNDVIERIDPVQLNQNVAAWAASIWMIANTDVTFEAPKTDK